MININTQHKQLKVFLSHTNKALNQVLNDIGGAKSENIGLTKDIGVIMDDILKQKDIATNTNTNKALLELVKQNPTLKSLGKVTQTIKDLLEIIKKDKMPLEAEKNLKNILLNVKDLNEKVLKQKLQDSGVFLESKIKNLQNPKVQLKQILQEIAPQIEKSNHFNSKQMLQNLTDVLKNFEQKDNVLIAKQLGKLTNSLHVDQNTVSKMQNLLDVVKQIEHKVEPKMLSSENFNLTSLSQNISQLSSMLPQDAKDSGIFKLLDKIVKTLDVIQKGSVEHLDGFLKHDAPKDIKQLTQQVVLHVDKESVFLNKNNLEIAKKILEFQNPQNLQNDKPVKDVTVNDLKTILSKAHNEVSSSNHPSKIQLLNQIDKLSMQIDYYQLVSHLSNSSFVYMPFVWDSLEDANIEIKKDKNGVFYCDIELKLKQYGDVKLKLAIYEKNQLNMYLFSDSDEFKTLIRENLPTLRSMLISKQVTPREIRFFPLTKKQTLYMQDEKDIDMGFEVKV